VDIYGFLRYNHRMTQDTETTVQENPPPYAGEDKCSFQWMRGIHAGIPGASVENFLARCREDKEHELAIEKRQEEERARRRANAKLSS
jgi:hypothetical protein